MISIIIPFHNRPALLARLFNSLRYVSRSAVQLVFVDNNADADSHSQVESFVTEMQGRGVDSQLLDEPTPGAAAARNAGLDAATGDYVYFFDSDDELSCAMVDDVNALLGRVHPDVIALRTLMVWHDGKTRRKHLRHTTSPTHHLVANNFATQSLVLRRDFALRCARWDESLRYWNDLEWAFRIMLAQPSVVWMTDTYHRIHQHPDSITGTSLGDSFDKMVCAHEAIERDIDEESTQALDKVALRRALNYRKALYAGRLYREGNKEMSQKMMATIDDGANTWWSSVKCKVLCFLCKHGLPGAWLLA